MRRAILALTLLSLTPACSDTPTSPDELAMPPYTRIFASIVTTQGTASRFFTAGDFGDVTLTLTETTPAGIALGMGVGIPREGGGGCILTRAVTTTAGSTPQMTMPVEAGRFCVQIYDAGAVASQAAFSMTLTHP